MKKKTPKTYIIVGDNNYWYSLGTNKRDEIAEARAIVRGMSDEPYGDENLPEPSECTVYEVREVAVVYDNRN